MAAYEFREGLQKPCPANDERWNGSRTSERESRLSGEQAAELRHRICLVELLPELLHASQCPAMLANRRPGRHVRRHIPTPGIAVVLGPEPAQRLALEL